MGGSRPPVGESAAIDAMINLLIRPPISISRPVQAAACPGTSCSMKTEKCPPPPNNRLPISDKWSIPPVSGKESIAASSCVGGVLFFCFLFVYERLWTLERWPISTPLRRWRDTSSAIIVNLETSVSLSLSLSVPPVGRRSANLSPTFRVRQHLAAILLLPLRADRTERFA